MSLMRGGAALLAGLIAACPASAAEREATVREDAFACVTWAAWREYVQASLTPRGARLSKLCPVRIKAKTTVVVVEDDAGAGATEISYRGKNWFVDNQRLE